MPSGNRRPNSPYSSPGSPYSPTNRPSPYGSGNRPNAPHYDRRANSSRRDIQMDRRRSKSPNRGPVIAGVILVIGILFFLICVFSGGQEDTPDTPRQTAGQTDPVLQQTQGTTPIQQTTTETKDSLIYTDDRVPNYAAVDPQWETKRFEWERQDNLGTMWLEISLDANMYQHYRSLERYYGIDSYVNYINDPNNEAIIAEIVRVIKDVANDLDYSDAAVVREVAKFVQDVIEYQYDSDTAGEDEYPRYPIETLYEGQGDCEDTSILMAAMLKELGYEVGFLHVPGHIAVALRTSDDYSGGAYYEINGHRYLFIESTGSGWNIGDIPEEFMEVAATFYPIN